jgi:hypothetical protein
MDQWKVAIEAIDGVIESGWSPDFTRHQVARILQNLEKQVKELTPPAQICRVCGNSTKG